jgi:predicted GIY-YIG superfamily endonuclease
MKSSKGQLVSQHLENVSREALEKYQDIIKDYVRRRQGIYALFRRNRLYYVGLASNLRNRLKHHLKDRHAQTWDRFSVYLTIKDEHMHELEALVLRIASPKGNRQTGKLVRSQDLRPEFKRAIHKFHQMEIKSIFGQSEKEPTEIVEPKAKDGRQPVLSSYVSKRFEIRLRFKGKLYKAMVRKDGSILYKGKTYNSPSLAGYAIKGRATNGWTTWKYERAPGDWVLLDTLRKK